MSKKKRSQEHSNERVYAMLWHMYAERLDGINRGLNTYQNHHHVGHRAVYVEDLIDHEPTMADAQAYLNRVSEIKRNQKRIAKQRKEELENMAQELLRKAGSYGYNVSITGILV